MLDWYMKAPVHYGISRIFIFHQSFYSVTGGQWWGKSSRMSQVVPTFSQLAHPN